MPTCANMCHSVSTWANIAVCQLCRERQPFWNSHDGLNLTCLDQCHGVGSHGTSSSQGKVYSLNLINEFRFRSLFSPKMIVAGLPLCTCYMSVFLSLCKQQPRFAQDQPKVYFQMKELDRTTEAFARMNVI